jgi:hypothetical protein
MKRREPRALVSVEAVLRLMRLLKKVPGKAIRWKAIRWSIRNIRDNGTDSAWRFVVRTFHATKE